MPANSTSTRLAIIGTAGHIDHGKTAMVRRLTGIDTDRLPEEKRRGISIDLGFAPLVTPAGVHAGIVDVPGHERFVKNMLAGVGGIDLVLLVIAADEGVMPQTREHLAIVRLLGVPRGIVVLTKADLVDTDWLEMIGRDVRALLAGTSLATAPIVSFSATTGAGQPELLAAIDRALADAPARKAAEAPRLPVDRVFTVEGFGTVVTGTLWRGTIRTGDALELLPARHAVRVRRVQVHGATVDEALAGQRTAVALHGVAKEQVTRGDWLVAPGSLAPSTVLDVRFELLPDYPRDWRAATRVRFHIGASEIIGRLLLLEGTSLRAGESALAQIRLEKPAVAARGDRFVIRSYSPSRTVGGGSVIEPVASKRRRRGAGLESLAVHESGDLDARIVETLAGASAPVTTAALAKSLAEPESSVGAAAGRLAEAGRVVGVSAGRWMGVERWKVASDGIARAVGDYATKHPARFGIPKGELKSAQKAIEPALFDATFDALVASGTLAVRGERVRPAGSEWAPPAETMAALQRLEAEFDALGLAVPENAAWQAKLGKSGAEVMALGLFLERLVRVSQELTYTSRQMDRLRAVLSAHFAKQPALTISDLRDLTGASRKYGVPLLEHCDRIGWTMRVGDERRAGPKLSAPPASLPRGSRI